MEIINFEEKEMTPLTNKEIKSWKKWKAKSLPYMKKKFCYDKNKKKLTNHCHYTRKFRGTAHSECNLRYKVP